MGAGLLALAALQPACTTTEPARDATNECLSGWEMSSGRSTPPRLLSGDRLFDAVECCEASGMTCELGSDRFASSIVLKTEELEFGSAAPFADLLVHPDQRPSLPRVSLAWSATDSLSLPRQATPCEEIDRHWGLLPGTCARVRSQPRRAPSPSVCIERSGGEVELVTWLQTIVVSPALAGRVVLLLSSAVSAEYALDVAAGMKLAGVPEPIRVARVDRNLLSGCTDTSVPEFLLFEFDRSMWLGTRRIPVLDCPNEDRRMLGITQDGDTKWAGQPRLTAALSQLEWECELCGGPLIGGFEFSIDIEGDALEGRRWAFSGRSLLDEDVAACVSDGVERKLSRMEPTGWAVGLSGTLHASRR